MAASRLPLHNTLKHPKGFEPQLWLVVVLLLLLLGKVVATVYFANTTFDFTDGGCYMLWYDEPSNDPHPFYYFHRIVLGLFPTIDWNIISLRILKMASELLVIAAMTFAVYQNLKGSNRGIKTLLFTFGFIGLGYFSTWFSWIFYEYDLTYLLSVVALSLVVGSLKVKRNWIFTWFVLLAGMLVSIQFFNKFSTSILLLLAIMVIVQLCRPGWRNHLSFLAGIVLGFGAFFVIIDYTLEQWYQEYLDGYAYLIKPLGYKPFKLIWMYILNLWPLPFIALSPIVLHHLLSHMAKVANVGVRPRKLFAIVLSAMLVIYYFTFPSKYLNVDNPSVSVLFYFWYFPLVSYFLYYAFYHIDFKKIDRRQWVMMIVWFVLPAVLFLGTATSATLSISSFLVPWYGLLLYLILKHGKSGIQYSVLVVAFVSCFVFVANHIERPYWTNKPIYYPRLAVQAPNEVILLDTARAQFVNKTKAILKDADIEPGYPIVALHDLPGLVYLVGGYSPATPWYFNVLDARQEELKCKMKEFNCLHISRISMFEERDPVFMINEVAYSGVLACLIHYGYDIEKEYERPRKVSNPIIRPRIRQFSKGSSDSLMIFIPKKPFTQNRLVFN